MALDREALTLVQICACRAAARRLAQERLERAAAWEDAAAEAGDPATMLIAGIARGAPSASILGRTPEEIEAAWPLLRSSGSSGEEIVKLLQHPRLAMELVDSWGEPHDDE
jgi:hypothetical protein